MPSIQNQPVLPGIYSQVQQQLLPSIPGGTRVACYIGTGRLTNLVVGEAVKRLSGNLDPLSHVAIMLDGTTISDQNFANYQLGVDYDLNGAFNVVSITDSTHLVVDSTVGLSATDHISQTNNFGTFTTTITTVTDSTHLVVGSTSGWIAGPAIDVTINGIEWLSSAASLTGTTSPTFPLSGLIGKTLALAIGSGSIQSYTFLSGDVATMTDLVSAVNSNFTGVITTAPISFTVTTVTDGTHLVVNSTTGMSATDVIVQGSNTTTITTVTDSTHLVVGSTSGWIGSGASAVDESAVSGPSLKISTTATTNSSLTIENGTGNALLGFTAGSLVSTPTRPILNTIYYVNYEWAKAIGDSQGSFTPQFFFTQNFSTITNAMGTVGGGDSQTANLGYNPAFPSINGVWSLPVAAQLAQQNGASVICLMQMNPNDGSNASQVRSALTKLFIPNINIVVSLDAADNAMLIPDITEHVVTASSTINRLERTAFIGFPSTLSDPNGSTMLGYATAASSNRVVVVNQSNVVYSMFIGTNQTASTVDGTMMATALSALRTNPAFDVAQPLTREVVSGIATTNTLAQAEKVILSNAGVLIVDNISGSPKVVFGTTTEFDTILNQLYQVTEITDYCTQTIRGLLDPIFIGQKLLANTPSQVETVTSAICSDIEASDIIESFTQPSATVNPLQPTQILVQVGVQPVLELDTILITLGLNLA